MMMVLLFPVQAHLNIGVYWVVMLTELMDWISKDYLALLLNGYNYCESCQTPDSELVMDHKMILFDYNRGCSPLPKKMMVFSCVQLHKSFVGWLVKLGYQFGTIFMGLHRLGVEGTSMFSVMMKGTLHV